jgi:hypothetical protein
LQHTIIGGMGVAREEDAGARGLGLIDKSVTGEMNVAVVLQLLGLDGFFARLFAEIDLALICRVKIADA